MAAITSQVPGVSDPFLYCEQLAKSHYENFSVVSWFLPKRVRRSMYAVYAFCRHTDDLGDEAPGDRLALLDAWEGELRRCYAGEPQEPIMRALQETIRRHEMPMEPFLKLIEANRMDQRNRRYGTYQDLLQYCEHSATPVGRMVLAVFGYRDEERQRLSDATCIALQLANFWQDVSRDFAMGRIYLPQEDMLRFGVSEKELAERKATPAFTSLMRFEVERARGLFDEGARLVPMVSSDLRLDLKLFTAGGRAILDAVERQGYDTLSRRPQVSKAKKATLAFSGLLGLTAQRLVPARG